MSLKRVLIMQVALVLVVTGVAGAQDTLFSARDQFSAGDTFGEGSRHSYTVRVEAGTTVEVLVSSETVDTYLEAELPGGEQLFNDDYQGLDAGFLRTIATTGTLRIDAQPLFDDAEGPYQVIVVAAEPPREIRTGEPIQARLEKPDLNGGRTAHQYLVEGEAGQRLTIDLTSRDFDAYLEARDATGREFFDDDGGSSGYDSRLTYVFAEAGTLLLTVTSFSGTATGAYELSVDAAAQELIADYRGELVATDERAYDGRLVDRYEYDGTEGETLAILLESPDFDTLLFVSGPDGRNLAQADDGGGGTNSMATVTLPTDGTYVIYVTSLFEDEGGYLLSLYR